MALFSFRHSVKTFSDKRIKHERQATLGQTASHLRYITRASAARVILSERVDARTAIEAESSAARRKGRVCERFIIALPLEASEFQREMLIREYCEKLTKGRAGYVAAIHDKSKNDCANPHAHIVMFDLHEKGTGRGRPRSVLGMARKNAVQLAAEVWAEHHNKLMREWGFGAASQISHRSFADRGIALLPSIHEGPGARAAALRGHQIKAKPEWHRIDQGHSRAEANALIRQINRAKEQLDEHKNTNGLGTRNEDNSRARALSGTECGQPNHSSYENDARTPTSSKTLVGNQENPWRRQRVPERTTPPFLATTTATSLAADAKNSSSPDFTREQHRWWIRRIYRELVMLRDTLMSKLQDSASPGTLSSTKGIQGDCDHQTQIARPIRSTERLGLRVR